MYLDALSLLETCEKDIELNCSPSINVDEEECNIIAKTFVEKYDNCNGKSLPQDKCNCIKDLAPDYEAVKKCRKRTTDVFSTSNKERNNCNLVFPACKSMLPHIVHAVIECNSLLSRSSDCACAKTDKSIVDEINYDEINDALSDLATPSPGFI